MLRIVVATAALVLAVLPARADPVAEFYKGQQIKLIVGSGAGAATTSMAGCLRATSVVTFPASRP